MRAFRHHGKFSGCAVAEPSSSSSIFWRELVGNAESLSLTPDLLNPKLYLSKIPQVRLALVAVYLKGLKMLMP